MARSKLTDKFIKALNSPGRYSDGANLYLRVRDTGSKSFIAMVHLGGKRIEVTIGPYGSRASEFTLASARARNYEIQAMARTGVDPRADHHAEVPFAIPEPDPVPAFGAFALQLISQIETGFRNEKHRNQWRSTLTRYCEPFWSKPIDAVTTDDVLGVLEPIWLTKNETASRVRGRVERVLDAAKVKGHRSGENPARWKGHLEVLLSRRMKLQRGHHPALQYKELPAVWKKIEDRDSISLLALKFVILTASRSGEVRDAMFDEFDLGKAVWTVPGSRMKAGREHRVPLSDAALRIFRHMQEIRMTDYVFPGARSGKPLTDMALLNAMKDQVSDVTVHGLRSTFRDWVAEETEFSRETAEAALAHHVGDQTERAYRRGDALEKRRKLMEAWAAFVTGTVTTDEQSGIDELLQ